EGVGRQTPPDRIVGYSSGRGRARQSLTLGTDPVYFPEGPNTARRLHSHRPVPALNRDKFRTAISSCHRSPYSDRPSARFTHRPLKLRIHTLSPEVMGSSPV